MSTFRMTIVGEIERLRALQDRLAREQAEAAIRLADYEKVLGLYDINHGCAPDGEADRAAGSNPSDDLGPPSVEESLPIMKGIMAGLRGGRIRSTDFRDQTQAGLIEATGKPYRLTKHSWNRILVPAALAAGIIIGEKKGFYVAGEAVTGPVSDVFTMFGSKDGAGRIPLRPVGPPNPISSGGDEQP